MFQKFKAFSLLLLLMLQIFTYTVADKICKNVNFSQYNILIIFVDDLRHLSDENINFPNIKKMAANGVSFENAFAQQSLCAPSRNSILTGRRPDSLRLYDFYSYWRDTVANFTTLPQFFKQHGYDTFSVGKVFHPGISSNFTDDYPYSWSHYPYHPPTERNKDVAVCRDRKTGTFHSNLVCPVNVKNQPGGSLPDLQSLEYASNILKNYNNSDKPFFLAVGFHKPHIPLKYPKQYLKRIPKQDVKPPKFPHMPKNLPLVSWHPWTDIRRRDDIKRLNIPFPMGIMPRKWTMKIKRSYYAAIMYIDDLIGILMSYVNKKRTIVVLTSDHGWSLGENGLWAKYSNFNAALKVPLILNIPGISRKSIHSPIEMIDLFPTLVDLNGLSDHIPKCNKMDKSPLCFEGKSLVPLMKNKSPCNESFALSQYPRPSVYPRINSDKPHLKDIKIMGYSIKTNRYRYTEWVEFNNTLFTRNWSNVYGIELYDHTIDPHESNNKYLDLKYTYIKTYLTNLLRSQVESK